MAHGGTQHAAAALPFAADAPAARKATVLVAGVEEEGSPAANPAPPHRIEASR